MNKELIDRVRSFEIDHAPDGWPAIRMRDISALADALEEAGRRITELEEKLNFANGGGYAQMSEACIDAAQQWEGELDAANRKLAIATDAMENLVAVKGRYHTEQAYNRIVEALKQINP